VVDGREGPAEAGHYHCRLSRVTAIVSGFGRTVHRLGRRASSTIRITALTL